MKKSIIILTLLFLTAACDPTQDAPDYQLGQPVLGGAGCLDSSVSLNEEGSGVLVDFSNFKVQAGGLYTKLQRKSCTLVVPLDVPKGYQVAIVPGVLKGKADIKSKTSLKVSLSTFLAGKEGTSKKLTIDTPSLGPFTFGGFEDIKKVEFSKCGESVNLRVNMSLLIKTKNSENQSSASITGFNGEKAEVFGLIFKECKTKKKKK
jgi:hypothetical protein